MVAGIRPIHTLAGLRSRFVLGELWRCKADIGLRDRFAGWLVAQKIALNESAEASALIINIKKINLKQ